jgi:hypothetical protein
MTPDGPKGKDVNEIMEECGKNFAEKFDDILRACIDKAKAEGFREGMENAVVLLSSVWCNRVHDNCCTVQTVDNARKDIRTELSRREKEGEK